MNKNGNMRLSRESKKCKKDFDSQIKKKGKITDNYVCAPDPEDPYTWYFVVFGLADEYEGGFYFGKVVCPTDYPARPPYITLMMNNGAFEPNEKICLSITDYHPESWNPAWTVTHIIMGCISFWMSGEETAGSLYDFEKDDKSYHIKKAALESRDIVLKNEKFEECLGFYKEFIGIQDAQVVEHWKPIIEEKEAAEKVKAEAKAKEEAEAKAKADAEAAVLKAEAEAKATEEESKTAEQPKSLEEVMKAFNEEALPELEKFEQVPILKAKSAFHQTAELKYQLIPV